MNNHVRDAKLLQMFDALQIRKTVKLVVENTMTLRSDPAVARNRLLPVRHRVQDVHRLKPRVPAAGRHLGHDKWLRLLRDPAIRGGQLESIRRPEWLRCEFDGHEDDRKPRQRPLRCSGEMCGEPLEPNRRQNGDSQKLS